MDTRIAQIIAAGLILHASHVGALTLDSIYGDRGVSGQAQSTGGVSYTDSSYFGAPTVSTHSIGGLDSYNGDGTDVFRTGEFTFTHSFQLPVGAIIDSAYLDITAGGYAFTYLSSVYIDGTYLGAFSDNSNFGNWLYAASSDQVLSTNRFNLLPYLSFLDDGKINLRIDPGRYGRDTWMLDFSQLSISYHLAETAGGDGSAGGTGGGGTIAPVPVPAAFWLFASGIVFLMRKRAVNK